MGQKEKENKRKEKGYITRLCKRCRVSSFGAGRVGVLLWGNFYSPSLRGTRQDKEGRLGQGPTGKPALGFQAQGHKCPHCRQMPPVGGIRAATCLELDRKAVAH